MTNPYYNPSGTPGTGAPGQSAPIRAEYASIAAGFAALPVISVGSAGQVVIVNTSGTALVTSNALTFSSGGAATFTNQIFQVTGGTPITLSSTQIESTGSASNYLSFDIRNASSNAAASGDFVATADTGTDTTQYINFGINSSGYSVGSWTINGALDGYLYTSDGNLSIGTAGAKYVSIFTGGTLAVNERMRIVSAGRVLIGTTTDDTVNLLQVNGGLAVQGTGTLTVAGLSTLTGGLTTPANVTLTSTGSLNVSGTGTLTVSSGASTLSGGVVTTSMNSGPLAGLRNRIINGDMRIDQRYNGASVPISAGGATGYTVDRFYVYCTGANVSAQRVAGTGVDQYYYQITGAASVTGAAVGQRIEATNIYDLAGTTATFSCKLANSLLTTVTWTAYYANAADTWPTNNTGRTQIATGTFSVTSTLTKYQTTIALPSAVTAGLEIELSVGAQTSGTWQIGEVQLETGSVATPFERVPFGMAIQLCQRYYEKSYDQTAVPGAVTAVGTATHYISGPAGFTGGGTTVAYKVPKFSDATITTYSNITGASGKIRDAANSADINATTSAFANGYQIFWSQTSATSVNGQWQWTATAEL